LGVWFLHQKAQIGRFPSKFWSRITQDSGTKVCKCFPSNCELFVAAGGTVPLLLNPWSLTQG
jgi:hypothetical protein